MSKKPNTKRALYLSVISLLLCVTMLVGATFAWFTDNASTNVSSIQAGTLDIDIVDAATNETLDGKLLSFGDVLWEPGATHQLAPFYIVNKGNLAVKYKVEISGIDGDAGLNNVIDWTIDGMSADDAVLLAGEQSKAITISGTMQSTAGNEYQGQTINGIAIKVYATQAAYESDSNDNLYDVKAQYDAKPWSDNASDKETDIKEENGIVEIYTAAGLAQFANNVNSGKDDYAGRTVKLMNDIDLLNGLWTPVGQTGATEFKGVFDGSDKTIYNLYIHNVDESATCSSGLFGWIESHGSDGVTVKNLTINGANVSGHHNVGVVVGYVYGTIENCRVLNATVSCTSVNDDANGDKCGLIAGYVGEDAAIKNCTGANSHISAGRDAGQIVGAAKAACVTGCSATNVTVTANGTCTGNNIHEAVIGRTL